MSAILDPVGALAGAGWPFVTAVAVKGAVLLALVLGLAAALRGTGAALRHRMWTVAFVGLLALPFVAAAVPAWHVGLLPAPGEAQPALEAAASAPAARSAAAPAPAAGTRAARATEAAGSVAGETTVETSAPPARARGTRADGGVPWTTWALVAWACGAALLLGRLAVGVVSAARIARRAKPLHDLGWKRDAWRAARALGLENAVRIACSDRIRAPMAWGILRPTLLLPAGAEGWSPERRRVVLLHELAHLGRRDCLVQVLVGIATALHWPDPLAWLGARRLRAERERACDDLVLEAGTPRRDYARHLVDIARSASRTRRAGPAAIAMAQPSQLRERLVAILDHDRTRKRPGRRSAAAVIAGIAALLVPLAAIQPVRAEPGTRASAGGTTGEEAGPATAIAVVPPRLLAATLLDPAGLPEPRAVMEIRSRTPAARDGGAPDRPDGVAASPTQGAPAEREVGPDRTDAAADAPRNAGSRARSPEGGASGARQEARADTSLSGRVFRAMLAALGDPDAGIREQAAHALGSMEDAAAVSALEAALSSEPEASVRAQIAWALGMIEDPAGVGALARAIEDPVAEVRSQAAWALGMIEDPAGVAALARAVDDEAASVRSQAAWGLGMIEDPVAVGPLTELLRDSEAPVRSRAAWALGMIEDPAGVPGLSRSLREDDDAEVRGQAAWALGMIEDGAAAEVLIDALDDEDLEVRKQAIWALSMVIEERL